MGVTEILKEKLYEVGKKAKEKVKVAEKKTKKFVEGAKEKLKKKVKEAEKVTRPQLHETHIQEKELPAEARGVLKVVTSKEFQEKQKQAAKEAKRKIKQQVEQVAKEAKAKVVEKVTAQFSDVEKKLGKMEKRLGKQRRVRVTVGNEEKVVSVGEAKELIQQQKQVILKTAFADIERQKEKILRSPEVQTEIFEYSWQKAQAEMQPQIQSRIAKEKFVEISGKENLELSEQSKKTLMKGTEIVGRIEKIKEKVSEKVGKFFGETFASIPEANIRVSGKKVTEKQKKLIETGKGIVSQFAKGVTKAPFSSVQFMVHTAASVPAATETFIKSPEAFLGLAFFGTGQIVKSTVKYAKEKPVEFVGEMVGYKLLETGLKSVKVKLVSTKKKTVPVTEPRTFYAQAIEMEKVRIGKEQYIVGRILGEWKKGEAGTGTVLDLFVSPVKEQTVMYHGGKMFVGEVLEKPKYFEIFLEKPQMKTFPSTHLELSGAYESIPFAARAVYETPVQGITYQVSQKVFGIPSTMDVQQLLPMIRKPKQEISFGGFLAEFKAVKGTKVPRVVTKAVLETYLKKRKEFESAIFWAKPEREAGGLLQTRGLIRPRVKYIVKPRFEEGIPIMTKEVLKGFETITVKAERVISPRLVPPIPATFEETKVVQAPAEKEISKLKAKIKPRTVSKQIEVNLVRQGVRDVLGVRERAEVSLATFPVLSARQKQMTATKMFRTTKEMEVTPETFFVRSKKKKKTRGKSAITRKRKGKKRKTTRTFIVFPGIKAITETQVKFKKLTFGIPPQTKRVRKKFAFGVAVSPGMFDFPTLELMKSKKKKSKIKNRRKGVKII